MQRITKFLGTNVTSIQNWSVEQAFVPNGIYSQCVRWKRKPIWLPTAKSKLFRVPKRPVVPPAEAEEMKRLYNNYRTVMKSLRTYFSNQYQKNKVRTDFDFVNEKVQEDFKKCSAINNEWNAAVAVEREHRVERERIAKLEKAAEKVQGKIERDTKRQNEVDERIRRLKEESVKFITAENIDTAIEEVLENVVDPNVALDINGQPVTDISMDEVVRNPIFNRSSLRYEDSVRSRIKVPANATA